VRDTDKLIKMARAEAESVHSTHVFFRVHDTGSGRVSFVEDVVDICLWFSHVPHRDAEGTQYPCANGAFAQVGTSTTVSWRADRFEVPTANLMFSIVTPRESSTSASMVSLSKSVLQQRLHSGF
jgi:hypothetical protein